MKSKLLQNKASPNYELLNNYIKFCSSKIRELLIALKKIYGSDQWKPYDSSDMSGVLNVTFVNGMLNLLRLLIENGHNFSVEEYEQKLSGIRDFNFRDYKSSQYRRMGQAIYDKFFC